MNPTETCSSDFISEYNCCFILMCNLPPQIWNEWINPIPTVQIFELSFYYHLWLFLFDLIQVFNITMHHSHTRLLWGKLYFINAYYRKSFKQNCTLLFITKVQNQGDEMWWTLIPFEDSFWQFFSVWHHKNSFFMETFLRATSLCHCNQQRSREWLLLLSGSISDYE